MSEATRQAEESADPSGDPLRPAALAAGPVSAPGTAEAGGRLQQLELQNEVLRLTQAELAGAGARYFELYDQAPVAYVTVSEAGVVLEANRAAATLLGVGRGELLEQPLTHFMVSDDHALYVRHCQQLVGAATPQACELRMRHKDGTPVWVLLAATIAHAPGGAASCRIVMTDISARRRMEASLRVKNFVFDAAMTANSVANLDGVLTEANDAFLRIWGYSSAAEVCGKPIAEFLNDPREAAAIVAALNATGNWEGEYTARRRDGSTFIANGLATVVRDGQGQLIGYQSGVLDITERKQAQEVLRQSEQLLRESQSVAGLGSYVLDITSGEWSSSDVLDQVFGIDSAYAHSMKGWAPLIHPEDRAMMVDYFSNEVLGQGRPFDKEYRILRHNDQATRWVHGRGKLEFDAGGRPLKMLGTIQDITERKQAAQALQELNQTLERRVVKRTLELRQSEARFRQLAEATFEGIAISEDGVLLDGNPQLAAIHGYELAEMIGRPLVDFVAPESRALVTTRLDDGSDATYEYVGLRKDGTMFPAESHARMGEWLGRNMRISAVRDLTTAKQAVARLHAQQTELEHAQRLALISELSAGIIHQLGQPLSAMAANLAVVKLGFSGCEPQCAEALEIVTDLEADVARMRDIVVHLRALANPEQPGGAGVNCNDIVAKVLPLLRQKAESRQVRLGVDLAQALPTVRANAVQLSQVILNLVSNAFEASDGCPPERRLVTLTTRALPGDGIELCVRDCGTGIAAEVMSRLFAPFFSTKPDGLGIGLRLSRTIVEAHGGQITGSNNADGVGATFRVVLPTHPS